MIESNILYFDNIKIKFNEVYGNATKSIIITTNYNSYYILDNNLMTRNPFVVKIKDVIYEGILLNCKILDDSTDFELSISIDFTLARLNIGSSKNVELLMEII